MFSLTPSQKGRLNQSSLDGQTNAGGSALEQSSTSLVNRRKTVMTPAVPFSVRKNLFASSSSVGELLHGVE